MASLVYGIQLPLCVIQDFVFAFYCLKRGGLVKTGHRSCDGATQLLRIGCDVGARVPEACSVRFPVACSPEDAESMRMSSSANGSTTRVLCKLFTWESKAAQVLVSFALADLPQVKHIGQARWLWEAEAGRSL